MPQLLKKTKPLLRTVNGKKRTDSEDAVPISPPILSSDDQPPVLMDDDDIERDPESSGDELASTNKPEYLISKASTKGQNPKWAVNPPLRRGNVRPVTLPERRLQPETRTDSDESEHEVFVASKRQRKMYVSNSRNARNIHAPPNKMKTYGGSTEQSKTTKQKQDSALRKRANKMKKEETSFIMPGGGDLLGSDDGTRLDAASTDDQFVFPSSVPSPEQVPDSSAPIDIDEIEATALDFTELDPEDTTIECICNRNVERELLNQFRDEFNVGNKQFNYVWQRRFCRYHQQHEARQDWHDRGYPEIDWTGLKVRLQSRKYTNRLRSVLKGDREAVFQKRHEAKVRGRKRTVLQSIDEDSTQKRGSAGYYGPRGEKMMSEHISQHFADELRIRATKDKVIAAAGVSGGISGFVQGILVPELAVCLIADDLDLKENDAADVIEQSASLGEILHPEVDDQTNGDGEDGAEQDDDSGQ